MEPISLEDTNLDPPKSRKWILIGGIAFTVIALTIAVIAAAGVFTNNGKADDGSTARSLFIPSTLQLVGSTDSSGRQIDVMHKLHSKLKGANMLNSPPSWGRYDTLLQDVEEDISLSRKGFKEGIKNAEMIACVMSRTGFEYADVRSDTQYYATSIDMRLCKEPTIGNETSVLEVDVRSRLDSYGAHIIDVYSPGWIKNGAADNPYFNRIRDFELYGTLKQLDQGFELSYEVNLRNGKDDTAGANIYSILEEKGYLRYFDDKKFYYYAEQDAKTKIKEPHVAAVWENMTVVASASVENSKALMYMKETPDIGNNYAYAIAYDGSAILVQNCTHGCHDLRSLPLYNDSEVGTTSGSCYAQNQYTAYDMNYCLYKQSDALIITDAQTFYYDYAPTDDLRGDNTITQQDGPYRMEYEYFDGAGCSINLVKCMNRTNNYNDSTYEPGCWRSQDRSDGYYDEQTYGVGGTPDEENVVGLKEGTAFRLEDGTFVNTKALYSLHILKDFGNATCNGITLGFPDFEEGEIPEVRPAQMITPENKGAICHTAGTKQVTFKTGSRVETNPIFFTPAPCSS